MFENVSGEKVFNLLTGTAGIYIIYFLNGIIHQSLIKNPYENSITGQKQVFPYAIGLILFPVSASWLTGFIINYFQTEKNHIPTKNSVLCASMVLISTLTYTVAIYWTNFPIVMMVKSCNLLSVILVAMCCTRVQNKQLKLGKKKIITGTFITVGIIMYNLLGKDDQQTRKDQGTKLWGVPLLIISLLADGFLPDFQAEIKSKFKPRPMEMFEQINKWVTILCLIYSILVNQLVGIMTFVITHHLFFFHLIALSFLSAIGQIFVYRMIKQFKQHVVPFVITTRKIFTVLLSIIFYNHSSTVMQMFGIALVFFAVCAEFLTELKNDSSHPSPIPMQKIQKVPLRSTQVSDSVQVEPHGDDQKQAKVKSEQDFVSQRIK